MLDPTRLAYVVVPHFETDECGGMAREASEVSDTRRASPAPGWASTTQRTPAEPSLTTSISLRMGTASVAYETKRDGMPEVWMRPSLASVRPSRTLAWNAMPQRPRGSATRSVSGSANSIVNRLIAVWQSIRWG